MMLQVRSHVAITGSKRRHRWHHHDLEAIQCKVPNLQSLRAKNMCVETHAAPGSGVHAAQRLKPDHLRTRIDAVAVVVVELVEQLVGHVQVQAALRQQQRPEWRRGCWPAT